YSPPRKPPVCGSTERAVWKGRCKNRRGWAKSATRGGGCSPGVNPAGLWNGLIGKASAVVRVIYHHRTQGRDVEAVHIRGLSGGLEQLGYEVEVVGPPGVEANPNTAASAANGKT